MCLLAGGGPRRSGRPGHHGGGVRRPGDPRRLHLRRRHRHLPQPDLVDLLVLREHRRAAGGAGGRRGPDEDSEQVAQPGRQAGFQRDQELLQEKGSACGRGALRGPRALRLRYGCNAVHHIWQL